MGSTQHRQKQLQSYFPPLQNYQTLQSSTSLTIYRNTTTFQEIMEHHQTIYNTQDIDRKFQTFLSRYQHVYLVSTLFLNFDSFQFCGQQQYKFSIFYQRVITNLSKINDIPFEDSLHCYMVALKGFQILYRNYGYFQVFENMFHICQNGKMKVWCNQNIYKSVPQQYLLGTGTQEDIVLRIINIIDQNTDQSNKIYPIKNHLLSIDKLTFTTAINQFKNICRSNKFIISQYLSSLRQSQALDSILDIYTPKNTTKTISKDINFATFYNNKPQTISNKTKTMTLAQSNSNSSNKSHRNSGGITGQFGRKSNGKGHKLTVSQNQCDKNDGFPKFIVNKQKSFSQSKQSKSAASISPYVTKNNSRITNQDSSSLIYSFIPNNNPNIIYNTQKTQSKLIKKSKANDNKSFHHNFNKPIINNHSHFHVNRVVPKAPSSSHFIPYPEPILYPQRITTQNVVPIKNTSNIVPATNTLKIVPATNVPNIMPVNLMPHIIPYPQPIIRNQKQLYFKNNNNSPNYHNNPINRSISQNKIVFTIKPAKAIQRSASYNNIMQYKQKSTAAPSSHFNTPQFNNSYQKNRQLMNYNQMRSVSPPNIARPQRTNNFINQNKLLNSNIHRNYRISQNITITPTPCNERNSNSLNIGYCKGQNEQIVNTISNSNVKNSITKSNKQIINSSNLNNQLQNKTNKQQIKNLPHYQSKIDMLQSFASNKILTQQFLANDSHALSNIKWQKQQNSGRDSIASALKKNILGQTKYQIQKKSSLNQKHNNQSFQKKKISTYNNYQTDPRLLEAIKSATKDYRNLLKTTNLQKKSYTTRLSAFNKKDNIIQQSIKTKQKQLFKTQNITKNNKQILFSFGQRPQSAQPKSKGSKGRVSQISQNWQQQNICSTTNGSVVAKKYLQNLDSDILEDMNAMGLQKIKKIK